ATRLWCRLGRSGCERSPAGDSTARRASFEPERVRGNTASPACVLLYNRQVPSLRTLRMRFRIHGRDRDTGKHVDIPIFAKTREEAIRIAEKQGIDVLSVKVRVR